MRNVMHVFAFTCSPFDLMQANALMHGGMVRPACVRWQGRHRMRRGIFHHESSVTKMPLQMVVVVVVGMLTLRRGKAQE
jgi:hypothetical protein